MYPGRFEYEAPATLEEALAALDRYGDEAKVLAGGQSLIPLMKLRFAMPRALVDINRVPGLDGLAEEEGGLRIGALVRHKDCERSKVLRGRFGVLGDAAPQISDPIVRNLGTVAGSLAPTEVITEVRVPDPGPKAGGTYLKLERKVGDYATAAVAVHLSFSNGSVERAGIALTGVGPRNLRAHAAEEALAGATLDDEAIAEAARLAAEAAEPQDDERGSADYKRNVVRVFTERGLRKAREV